MMRRRCFSSLKVVSVSVASGDQVEPGELYEHGCLVRLIKLLKFPDETVRVLVQGEHRVKILRYEGNGGYLKAQYVVLKDEVEKTLEMEALARNASQRFQEVITMSPTLPEELKVALFNTDDPGIMPTTLRTEYALLREAAIDLGISRTVAETWLERLRELGVDQFLRNHQPVFTRR